MNMASRPLRLVGGLGNIGGVYARTLHNAGFLFLDFLGGDARWITHKTKRFAHHAYGTRMLVRPRGFMNESGAPIRAALRFFGAVPEELLLVHDDADLPLGTARLSYGRGAGGHHGVESGITALRTADFWRLRIGIRTPESDENRMRATERRARAPAGTFVLSSLKPRERTALERLFQILRESVIENDTPPSPRTIFESGSATSLK